MYAMPCRVCSCISLGAFIQWYRARRSRSSNTYIVVMVHSLYVILSVSWLAESLTGPLLTRVKAVIK